MMGQRQFVPKLFYQFSLDSLVPETHLLKRIAAAVDFSFIRPLCRRDYSTTGQPSIDPVVLFKMLLVGYLYGITSERRLAQEVELHLAYRWSVGYDLDEAVPDHSVLSKARARLGPEVFEEFFRRSIALCQAAGLLSEGPVYIDSTLFRTAAAVDSMVQREELPALLSVSDYLGPARSGERNARRAPASGVVGPGAPIVATNHPVRKPCQASSARSATQSGEAKPDGPRGDPGQPAGVRPPSRLQGASRGGRHAGPGDHSGGGEHGGGGGRTLSRRRALAAPAAQRHGRLRGGRRREVRDCPQL
jgi:transposase